MLSISLYSTVPGVYSGEDAVPPHPSPPCDFISSAHTATLWGGLQPGSFGDTAGTALSTQEGSSRCRGTGAVVGGGADLAPRWEPAEGWGQETTREAVAGLCPPLTRRTRRPRPGGLTLACGPHHGSAPLLSAGGGTVSTRTTFGDLCHDGASCGPGLFLTVPQVFPALRSHNKKQTKEESSSASYLAIRTPAHLGPCPVRGVGSRTGLFL